MHLCAERLEARARVATLDDVTPNSGTVVFVDDAGVKRTLDIVSVPFGLNATEAAIPCFRSTFATAFLR